METKSGQSPDALELVVILKRLGAHRQKAWDRTFSEEFLDNLNKIRDEIRKALRADDRNAAGDLLCRFVNAANGECPEDSRRQMLAKLESIMESRRATLGSGDTNLDVMPAELGPEAEKAFDLWVRIRNERFTPEESAAYSHHPLLWLCGQLEERLGIKREDLETAAYRLTSILGLRRMKPLPAPDGTVGDEGQPDWLWMIPKFKELDRDGTTARLWQTLLDNFPNVLVEAGLAPADVTERRGVDDPAHPETGSPSQDAEIGIPAPPSTLAEFPAWIQAARELLRGQGEQPIDKNGIAFLVRKHFLDHLERLRPEWAQWQDEFQSQKLPTVRDLVAKMELVRQHLTAEAPPPRVVKGFAAGSDKPPTDKAGQDEASGGARPAPTASHTTAPIVFISSTIEDLEEHRGKARDAINQVGFVPRMKEYFAARGDKPPLAVCLEKVSGSATEPPADVVVLIVAHRYGWVPEDQPGSDRKSIT